MFQKAIVLINDEAGTVLEVGQHALIEGLRERLRTIEVVDEASVEIQCFPKEELVERLEAAASSDADLVIVGGGDGSAAAAATLLRETEKTLGILPLGTMNLFAKDLGIPVAWGDALEAILTGEPAQIDVGEINGRLFLNRCSLGFYPKVIEQWKHTRGSSRLMRYARFLWLSLAWWMWSRRSYLQCEVDGTSVPHPPTRSIFVVNNPYASTTLGPVPSRPDLNTGKLGVYIAYHQRLWERLRLYTRVLAGRWQQDAGMMVVNASEVCIRAPKRGTIKIVVDGEIVACELPLSVRSCPGAIRVMRPTQPVVMSVVTDEAPVIVPGAMAA